MINFLLKRTNLEIFKTNGVLFMYCRYCGKELRENEVCICELNSEKTVLLDDSVNVKNSRQVNPNSKKIIIAVIAVVLIVVSAFGIFKAVKSIEKKKAYEAIELQAMAELDEIMSEYEVLTTAADRPYKKYYSNKTNTGVTLSNNLFDFTFKLDDTVYALPTDIKTFLGNGWVFDEFFDDFEIPVNSEHLKRSYLLNGENRIDVEVYNYSGNQELFYNCPVGSISYDFSGSLNIYLADNFLLNGKTAEDVLQKFGEPYMMSENVWCEIVYQKKIHTEYIIVTL